MGNHDVISKKEFLKVNLEDEILIHHFPIRNLKHFKAKVINGTEAYLKNPQVDKNSCWHWRAWYKLYNENKLEDEYKKISLEYNNKNYTHLTKKTRVPIKIKNAKLIFNFKKILS